MGGRPWGCVVNSPPFFERVSPRALFRAAPPHRALQTKEGSPRRREATPSTPYVARVVCSTEARRVVKVSVSGRAGKIYEKAPAGPSVQPPPVAPYIESTRRRLLL